MFLVEKTLKSEKNKASTGATSIAGVNPIKESLS